MNSFRQRPNWVDEEPLIQSILNHFLDQIDIGDKPQFKVTSKSASELYDFDDDDPKYLWHLIKLLDTEYHLLGVKKIRQSQGRSYDNAQLFLNHEKEAMLREWLNRPALDPYSLVWKQRLEKIRHRFEDGGHALDAPIRVDYKGADEVLNGFSSIADAILLPQTLRNLSARCFWGDSKFLDSRFELLANLFPHAVHNIVQRPLMINVLVPDSFNEVLFIENFDSFLLMKSAVETNPRYFRSALVYSAGFNVATPGVRNKGHVVFSHLQSSNEVDIKRFERWWLRQTDEELACYFWGDLDFAAMAILAGLRRSFPALVAWKSAYDAMLNFLELQGHSAKETKKELQRDPIETGCDYADTVLLTRMREKHRFLDQEILGPDDIQKLQ